MARAVRFDHYGGRDVLYIAEVDIPTPAEGHVVVAVRAAGINPGEAAIRAGAFEKQWPATFPSGQGTDFAGVVEAVGAGVTKWRPGDEVVGFTNERASHAELVVVPEGQVTARPSNVPWEQAGALFVAGTTAYAAVHAVSLRAGHTLVVSGAAGGVGSLVVQLATGAGATVIGLASAGNHGWLRDHGITPVAYGEGTAARIRKLGGKVDAFIDTFGHGYVDLAIELGVSPQRINTIADFPAIERLGVHGDGTGSVSSVETLLEIAGLVADGELEIPIERTYPLAEVQEAYRELAKRTTRGKIVLMP